MNKVKRIIKTTSISLVVAAAIISGASSFFLASPVAGAPLTLEEGVKEAEGEGVAKTLFGRGGIFTTVVNILLFIIGAISVVMLIFGGVRYATSAGDSNAVTGAKNTILYAVVGLVIAFLAYAVVNWLLGSLMGSTT